MEPQAPAPTQIQASPSPTSLVDDMMQKAEAEGLFASADKPKESVPKPDAPKIDTKPKAPPKADAPAVDPTEPKPDASALPDFKPAATASDPEIPANLSPSAAKNFETIKTERNKLRHELSALKKQHEELSKNKPPVEFEDLKKQNEELSKAIQTINVERHPQFQKYFTERTEQALELVKNSVDSTHADLIKHLVAMPDSPVKQAQMNEIFSTLEPYQAARLSNAITKYEEVQQERRNELAKASANWQAIQQQQQAQQEAQQEAQKKQMDTIFEQVTEESRQLPVFALREGDDGWNNKVSKMDQLSKRIFTGDLPPQDMAKAARWAAAAPMLLQQLNATSQQVAQLQAELAQLRSASPGTGDSGAASSDAASSDNLGYLDSVEQRMRQAGIGRRW